LKTFVIGDIHGGYKALAQCLKRSNFDYEKDRLVALGDVCDGWPEVHLCIDELLKIKNLDYLIGNHDAWTLEWAKNGFQEEIWVSQGGNNTLASYHYKKMPQAHREFLESAKPWLEIGQKLFVHAGITPERPIEEQTLDTLIWDRVLVFDAFRRSRIDPNYRYADYEEIYVGHTTTQIFYSSLPLKLCNLWAMDTGCGWSGKLTIMDIDTKKYWQSDEAPSLYPHVPGRSQG